MQKIEILVGSMLGATEYVADAICEKLQEMGIPNQLHLKPDIADLDRTALWLICTSTHGAGELPDNIKPFSKQLEEQHFPHLSYLLVGLGDSSYDTFCEGAKQMQKDMDKTNAELLAEPILVDVLQHPVPEDEVIAWFESDHIRNKIQSWLQR
ncbi:flavodoxin domain-containing protein [Bowmanella pacifica]|uniref:Flavodoxin-like domain-containing protein n=1 Tax=Bowmanella pacifica TaxID=502051 RepID=A0A917YU58_9ALTE|nr:flavodoxin domain-containing protein [Bowmanella pacifica]GGO66782.1 hypothetical protein GCM10010982_11780 [Bowmanella pacifica]